MVEFRPLDPANLRYDRRRWLVGLWVDRLGRRLAIALVANETRGIDTRVEIVDFQTTRLRRRLCRRICVMTRNRAAPWRSAALVSAYLAEAAAAEIGKLASRNLAVWDRVSTVGVLGPGLRTRGQDGLIASASLGDAARLAEWSGLNVVDDFASRDIAHDGAGEPLLAVPWWMLVRQPEKSRVVFELGRIIRWTKLPASRASSGHAMTSLTQLSAGVVTRSSFDESMKCKSADACEQMASAILATGQLLDVDEWMIVGGGKRSLRIADALRANRATQTILTEADLHLPPGSLQPAAAAMLAALFLDQAPANATMLTGARAPRLLGRITPGSAQNWQRVVFELAQHRAPSISLRSAI